MVIFSFVFLFHDSDNGIVLFFLDSEKEDTDNDEGASADSKVGIYFMRTDWYCIGCYLRCEDRVCYSEGELQFEEIALLIV